MEDIRIVLLGKTGAGKSSAANTMFGEDVFQKNDSPNAGTSKCKKETRSVSGKSVTLIDTPGFFDPDKSKKELRDDIVTCITECAPGPHVFLILLKVEKFTKHEKQVIDEIRKSFSDEVFRYAAVVFTHGDQLPEGMKIKEFVQESEGLRDLVKKCGERCHVIDNKYWKENQPKKYRSNQPRMAELLKTIDKIVLENNGGYYTNEMLQTVWSLIKKHGKIYVSNFLKMSAGITTGVLLGALLGLPLMISLVVKVLITMQPPAAAAAVEVAVGAAVGESAVAATVGTGLGIAAAVASSVGAVAGGCIGYCEADKADSVGEAVKNTAKSVCNKFIPEFKKIQVNKKQQQSEEKGPLLKDE